MFHETGLCLGGGLQDETYQCLEQIHDDLEEVDSFHSSLIVRVASRVEGADTCSVSGPLVLPEILIGLIVTVPVRIHVVQELGGAVFLNERSDIIIVTARVAVFRVVSITVIWPQSMDTPGVCGAYELLSVLTYGFRLSLSYAMPSCAHITSCDEFRTKDFDESTYLRHCR